jgi:putative restriction endonuclease
MRMRGWVANTHSEWFDFLAARGSWVEVNFWNPSDYYAFRGEPGSPFFFRLKAPRNAIGGFGLVSGFARLPEWLAWEAFGEANGAADFQQMQARLNAIRERNGMRRDVPLQQIGCILLSSAVYFPKDMWVRQPSDWGAQNLRYKGYELNAGEGLRIWRECQERAAAIAPVVDTHAAEPVSAARWGRPMLIVPRKGQGTFRVAVTEAYDRACSVTGEHSLPALEAAHIRPFSVDGPHAVANGLLLRSDLHRLFDRGYLTVTTSGTLEVSKQLHEHFSNGRSYYPLHGTKLVVPKRISERPDPLLLRWHNEHRFLS